MKKKVIRMTMGVVLIGTGLFVFLTARPDLIYRTEPDGDAEVVEIKQQLKPNSVYIPKISRVFSYRTGGVGVLEKGGWHRYPERGGPGRGNFIIAAHRYRATLSPWRAYEAAPLMRLQEIELGDDVVVTDVKGNQLDYEVSSINEVNPEAIDVENQTQEHILTLYSCTAEGAADGRIVVVAEPAI